MDLQYLSTTYDYSFDQMERFRRVNKELNKVWQNVINEIKFCRENGMETEQVNKIMTNGLYRLYFAEYRYYFNKRHPQYPQLKRRINFKQNKLEKIRKNIYEL